ncbi:MAG: magnesium transporter [Erysipelotrichia bacterium]|nr:magnesium transporter [Erysipelotrichia bacterium]
MQKVIYKSQINDYSSYFKPNMLDHLNRNLTESFEGFDYCDLMSFEWYNINDIKTGSSQIMIYIDDEDLFFLCEEKTAYDKCCSLLTQSDNNERTLYLFFVGLLAQDAKRLDRIEIKITDSETAALKNSKSDYLNSILSFRKELLRLKRYYQELYLIMDYLIANDNALFSKDGARHFSIVHNRVERFCSDVANLHDYVTQMREACQSQIDIEQNSLMRIFTVVTTIFMPLTLIVGWYGMNFSHMPELEWEYGYLGVIVLSIAVSGGMIMYFRYKKWF